jgi:sugar lactone lactonase YvrE
MPETVGHQDDAAAGAEERDRAGKEYRQGEVGPDAASGAAMRAVEMEGELEPEIGGEPGGGSAGAAGSEGGGVEGDDGVTEGEGPEATESDLDAAAEGATASSAEIVHDRAQEEAEERKRRRRLLVVLGLSLLALSCTITTIVRYVTRPVPLPDLLPAGVEINYAPHYLFSIYGLDKPVGVALSPDGDRLYVAETGGERLVKIVDRDGSVLGSAAPPRTGQAERSPVYLATDSSGRVFVADRLQHALFVYDREGRYLDTILGPDLTLSEHVLRHTQGAGAGAVFAYDAFETVVYYLQAGEGERALAPPEAPGWSPLGVRIDASGRMLVTDVSNGGHSVWEIPADVLRAPSWHDFDPHGNAFGIEGQGDGHFSFPNVAVAGSMGRIYVTDGNNGRISVWNDRGGFLYDFGQGAGEGALNLPRGAAIDARDHLHVVDAVGQCVKVYDVSERKPRFLFAFGGWGAGDGQFNYPNDIALDATGRLYIADRENNCVQVWSY